MMVELKEKGKTRTFHIPQEEKELTKLIKVYREHSWTTIKGGRNQ